MNRNLVCIAIIVIAVSCGEKPGPTLTEGEMELISGAAGMLARNLAYLPDSSGWSPAPDISVISELEGLAAANVEVWPVFFRAAADTAAKLEQIMIQQQQELQLEQFL